MNTSNASAQPSVGQNENSGGPNKSVMETVRQTAADLKNATTATATQAVDGLKQTATDKKNQTADRVQAYGSAIHDSAKSLERDDPNIAWFTHQAADRLQGVANYVRQRDFQGLREDVEDLARRHPLPFFGGLCLVGLVLGNIVKASGKSLSATSSDEYAPDFGGQPDEDYAPSSPSETASAGI
jgi:hypothetical protein